MTSTAPIFGHWYDLRNPEQWHIGGAAQDQ